MNEITGGQRWLPFQTEGRQLHDDTGVFTFPRVTLLYTGLRRVAGTCEEIMRKINLIFI